jgi:hypothetical protein
MRSLQETNVWQLRGKCSFASNGAGTHGGAIVNSSTAGLAVDIRQSTFTGNVAMTGNGGGFFSSSVAANQNQNVAEFVLCTFQNNTAYNGGGTYVRPNSVGFANCTINGNRAINPGGAQNQGMAQGGGVCVDGGGTVFMVNTILANNNAQVSADLSGGLQSGGHNLIGNGDGGFGYGPSDLVGTSGASIDPLLSPLGDYGGPTQTEILLSGSPALRAGDPNNAPATDQRGLPRVVNGFMDIGAVQMNGPLALGSLTGQVWIDANGDGVHDAGELGLGGITVGLYLPDGTFMGAAETDAHGQYTFGAVAVGTYYVQFTLPPNYRFTLQHQGSDPALDSDPDVNGITQLFAVLGQQQLSGIDAGLIAT